MKNEPLSAQLARVLKRGGCPAKNVNQYGGQVVATYRSLGTAESAAALLSNAFKIRGVIECSDYAKVNKGGAANPTTIKVWKVYACVV